MAVDESYSIRTMSSLLSDDDKHWFANHIAGRIAESEQRMSALIAQSADRMSARIEKTETTLLTEFHKWASPVECGSEPMQQHSVLSTPKWKPSPTQSRSSRLANPISLPKV